MPRPQGPADYGQAKGRDKQNTDGCFLGSAQLVYLIDSRGKPILSNGPWALAAGRGKNVEKRSL